MDADMLEKQNRIIDYQCREMDILNGIIEIRNKTIRELEAALEAMNSATRALKTMPDANCKGDVT